MPPVDPWANPTKTYPIGIHPSEVYKPNDVYPVYDKETTPLVPGREDVVVDPDGGPELPFTQEYPSYLYPSLVGVHGAYLFHEEGIHWQYNPALGSEPE